MKNAYRCSPSYVPSNTEDKIFYTDDDLRDFLSRRGWICLREYESSRNVEVLDELHGGGIYCGISQAQSIGNGRQQNNNYGGRVISVNWGRVTLRIGLMIKLCSFEDMKNAYRCSPGYVPSNTEDKIFYTDDDLRDFLYRRGWICLRNYESSRNVEVLDELHGGGIYCGQQSNNYNGRVISVNWGRVTRRIGIDGPTDAIKETIKTVFNLRTNRAFWLEDSDRIVRTINRDMPQGNYTLHVDEGIFDVLAYADKDVDVPFTWTESDPKLIENPQMVKLHSFDTKIHKVDTLVSYKNDEWDEQ
nr:mitotic spindle checkpoint protein MAD2 [Tanacetum cinerariifolium]